MSFRVVYNVQYGGISLSNKCMDEYIRLDGSNELITKHRLSCLDADDKERSDPILIKAIENIGLKKSSGKNACLWFCDIPEIYRDHYTISEYDGLEEIDLSKESLVYSLLEELKNKRDEYNAQPGKLNILFDELCNNIFNHELDCTVDKINRIEKWVMINK
jgi:hypothetical protein